MKSLRLYLFILIATLVRVSGYSGVFLKVMEPKDNMVVTPDRVHFQWNTSFLSGQYQLQISTDVNFVNNVVDTLTSQGEVYRSLNENTSYYWRVRLKAPEYVSNWSRVQSFSTINPKTIGSSILWYDAQDTLLTIGSAVSRWKDKSFSLKDAVQATVAKQPVVANAGLLLSNRKVLRFDGVDDFMDFTRISNIRSAFFLFKHRTGTQPNSPPILGDPTFYDFHGSYSDATTLFATFASNNILNGKAYVNKVTKTPTTILKSTQYNILSLVTIGNVNASTITKDRTYNDRNWDGDYAEIILYSDTLNSDKRNKVEDYLRCKYAAPLSMRDSITSGNFCDSITINTPSNYASVKWFNGSTASSIRVAANGEYTVSVKDIFGLESQDQFLVCPYKRLSGATIYMCAGQVLNINLPVPPSFSVLWSTGSSSKNISITDGGLYTFRVTDANNCYIFDTINVVVDKPDVFPTPDSLGALSLCKNEKLFLNTATLFDSIRWSTGESANFITVSAPGSYTVFGRTIVGCVINKTFNISIAGEAPIANFISPVICQNSTASFLDSSIAQGTGIINTWKWTFGDGNTVFQQFPSNTYTTTGSFNVGLKITTDQGCSDSISKTIYVNKLPKAKFDNRLSCASATTNFQDLSDANAAALTNWSWDFNGLGTINDIQNPSFIFPAEGTYNVTLRVTNSNQCQDTVTNAVLVNPSPVADFSFDSICGRNDVHFKWLSSTAPPSTIQVWSWDFGDGTFNSSIKDVAHAYDITGEYDVTLTVRSTNACSDTAIRRIKIFEYPTIDFDISATQCVGKEIQFTDISTTPDNNTPIAKWNWYFSGQATSSEQNPRYTFNAEGNYTIQLTAANSIGCSGTKLRSIAVSLPPVPKFSFTPENGLPPLTVNYTNQSTATGNYFWNYGDNTGPLVQAFTPPSHTYTAIGSYPIQLIATDFRGCTDTLTKYILVDKAYLDGVMATVTITPDGDFYKVQAVILNNSNVEIRSLGLSLQLGGGSVVRENWEGSLLPGQSVSYTFISQIRLSDVSLPVICATIENINNYAPEDRTDNNSACKEAKIGTFDVLNIYPNPAYDNINFGVMLPRDGSVSIAYLDYLGRELYKAEYTGLKGYNNFIAPTSLLNAAVYIAVIKFDGEIIRKKFVCRGTGN